VLRAKQAELEELFRDEFAKAKTPQAKSELAKTMLAPGQEIDEATVDRFVFLNTAVELAGESGDGKTSLAAIELLEKDFNVDSLQLKTDVAVKSAKILRGPKPNHGLAQFAAQLMDQAVEQQRFKLVDTLRYVGLSAARKSGDRRLSAQLLSRVEEIKDLESAYNKAAAAIATLAQNSEDPEANLVAGRYYCFVKGDFEKGYRCWPAAVIPNSVLLPRPIWKSPNRQTCKSSWPMPGWELQKANVTRPSNRKSMAVLLIGMDRPCRNCRDSRKRRSRKSSRNLAMRERDEGKL